MAIYFPDSDSLLLLPPKTGSKWIRHVVRSSKLNFEMIGPPERKGHGELKLFGRSFSNIGAFVRHPATWHYSYWWYRSRGPSSWEEIWPLDKQCAAENFSDYAKRTLQYCPGYASQMFETYTGAKGEPIDFVGKLENLRSDFIAFLEICGENPPHEMIMHEPPINVSLGYTEADFEALNVVQAHEVEALERYGYEPLVCSP